MNHDILFLEIDDLWGDDFGIMFYGFKMYFFEYLFHMVDVIDFKEEYDLIHIISILPEMLDIDIIRMLMDMIMYHIFDEVFLDPVECSEYMWHIKNLKKIPRDREEWHIHQKSLRYRRKKGRCARTKSCDHRSGCYFLYYSEIMIFAIFFYLNVCQERYYDDSSSSIYNTEPLG